ncbi:UDP-N-acetylmuramoyl-tripeptide--D-alanyl-D-alanine ligase [Nitratireductor thuwali]|uniref:UDP-N-acetylmuramoyl-tripeptide--D-alanyl-D-alanine ligase n=1 Tax=Nitratireductor thuwali TaxID=2267699 RepID=A0ABY5MG28_9HYPH|nr:UDP-N-acetylmuramoyl-tripeptide--D-alanyl-D-alanine ligase [Nitratireductor thuwali]
MNILWDSQALVAATGGRPQGNMPEGVSGISIDTRTLKRGEAFFAIKGENFDGHDFGTAAIAAGAGVLVVAEEKLPALGRLAAPKIVVPDVLQALEKVGQAARSRSRAKIIAVTGSVGKTTTKAMLSRILSRAGTVHAADKSFNNHWGVPLSLARMPEDCDYAVFEIGMNHPGEITSLVGMVLPHIAVVTAVAAAHLGFFKSLDEIARAKGEIFSGVLKGGHALINRDDERWKLLSKMAAEAGIEHIWGFGEHARAQFKLMRYEPDAQGAQIDVKAAGQELSFRLGATGRHMVQNALAALGAAHLAGADLPRIVPAFDDFAAEEGRGRRHVLRRGQGTFTLIDESYNANPASMQAALRVLATAPVADGGRRIAVLGDMLELGSHSQKLHAGLAPVIADARADILLLAGAEMKALADNPPKDIQVEYRANADELQPLLLNAVRAGDTVMIKSSKSIGFSKLVEALTKHFPAAVDKPARG